MTQPEARFKARLKAGFEKVTADDPHAYWTSLAAGLGQKSGLPDRLCCAFGASAWIEAKWGKGKLSDLQMRTCSKLARGSQRVVVMVGEEDRFSVQPFLKNGELSSGNKFDYKSLSMISLWTTFILGE
jgi:hypothetical protein